MADCKTCWNCLEYDSETTLCDLCGLIDTADVREEGCEDYQKEERG